MNMRLCLGVCFVLAMSKWRQTTATQLREKRDSNRIPSDSEGVSGDYLAAVLDRLDSLDRSITELKTQMATLLDPSSNPGMHRVLKDLQGVCEELKASQVTQQPPEDTTTPEVAHKPCPQQQPSSQLVVTDILKEETETAYIVTVCYTAPAIPEVSRRLALNGEYEQIDHDVLGTVTTKRNKSQTHQPAHLSFDFKLGNQHVHLSLRLDEKSANETHLPIIQLQVEPGSDIIVEPGQELVLKFDIHNEVPENMSHKFNITSLNLKSNSEENMAKVYRLAPGIEVSPDISGTWIMETVYSSENTTQILYMPYSPDRRGGFVIFQMVTEMFCPDDCILERHIIGQHVVFHPPGEGPFPEGFVGFVKEKDEEWKSPVGREEIQCFEDNRVRNCLLGCMAVGDDPTISLQRADPRLPTSAHSSVVFEDYHYFASAFWEFQNPTQADAGAYQCRARAQGGLEEITKTLTVTVGRVAEIARNQTWMTPEYSNLKGVCIAHGIPAPNVTFAPYYGSEPNPAIDDAVTVMTKLNDTTSQATFFLADWRNYDGNDINNIYCVAENAKYSEVYEPMYVEDLDDYM